MQETAHHRDSNMLKTASDSTASFSMGLECKQCHRTVSNEDTVAYHLVDQILYGWCQSCFGHRHTAAEVLLGDLPS